MLSRFRGEADLMDVSPRLADQDEDWQHMVTLKIKPDSRLSSEQQEVIAHDYNMSDGHLELPVRAKLAPYLLQVLNVNTGPLLEDPRAQQLVLTNQNAVTTWLMSYR